MSNYDKYLEDERELLESIQEDTYRVWMVFVARKGDKSMSWYDSDEKEEQIKTIFEGCKELYDKVELGWIWNNDFDFRNIEKTYRLLEVEETYER